MSTGHDDAGGRHERLMTVQLIAEWGIPADLATATRQVQETARMGAAWCKWQHLTSEKIASADACRYWDPKLGGHEFQAEQFAKGGLTPGDWRLLRAGCGQAGVGMLVTPFDLEAVDVLDEAGVDAFKVASGDITFRPLLEKVASKNKPVLLSTGASSGLEINAALHWLDGVPVVVMACDLVYPCPPEDANFVATLTTLKTAGWTLGYSDHTREIVTGALAVAHGATVLEKHVTLTPGGTSPDDHMALNVEQAAEYLRLAEQAAVLCAPVDGDPEAPARVGARRSAYATRDMQEGHVLAESDVAWLRPCPEGAIPASCDLTGLALPHAVNAGEQIPAWSRRLSVVLSPRAG